MNWVSVASALVSAQASFCAAYRANDAATRAEQSKLSFFRAMVNAPLVPRGRLRDCLNALTNLPPENATWMLLSRTLDRRF